MFEALLPFPSASVSATTGTASCSGVTPPGYGTETLWEGHIHNTSSKREPLKAV